MTTYYVSSLIGNDNNAGTSASAPLATLQDAANIVKAGDTVEVMNGTYTSSYGGDALNISTSGTASAPITFEAAQGATPVINSSGGWYGINIQASYITVEGFTVVGDAANYNLASATAAYSTSDPDVDGNGICVNPANDGSMAHNVIIENNTVYNEPGGGINTEGADYVQVLNNTVYNNANWSAYGNSGISISTSENYDNASGAHIIVSGNLVYDNAQLVPTFTGGGITDGEGIILDTNPDYTAEMLVENNTIYGSGGPAIVSFLTNNAVITGNTVYDNNTVEGDSADPIAIVQSNNNTVSGNIYTASTTSSTSTSGSTTSGTTTQSTAPATPVISSGVAATNGAIKLTGTAAANSTVTVVDWNDNPLGTATVSASGAWTYTTVQYLPNSWGYGFQAYDTTSSGQSALSNTVDVTVATNTSVASPTLSSVKVNANDSLTITGTALANTMVAVWANGGWIDDVTSNASGAFSYTTTAGYTPGAYAVTATETTSAGTGNPSAAINITAANFPGATPVAPSAPVISGATLNTSGKVTLTGTAPDGSAVTVSDTASGVLGTATANASTGAWTFSTAALAQGAYDFTATDATSAGTSAVSNDYKFTVPAAAAPVVSTATAALTGAITLKGTAPANSTVTVVDWNDNPLGTASASASGAWTYTTFQYLPNPWGYGFQAYDTTAAGTSALSNTVSATVATNTSVASPSLSSVKVNANDSLTITGTALANTIIAIWANGGWIDDLTSTASGAFSYTTAAGYAPAAYAITATETTSAGTGNPSKAIDITAANFPIPAPVISRTTLNPNDTVTLTGTAPDGSTVTVSNTKSGVLGTATANATTGAWTFSTAALAEGAYDFTAKAASSSGTSVASNDVSLSVNRPAAPIISSGTANSNATITLKGTAPAGTTVKVSDTASGLLGSATASSAGSWTYKTAALLPGTYDFTATDSDSVGTSVVSSDLKVSLVASSSVAIPAISKATVSSTKTITLTGSAAKSSTVTIWTSAGTEVGTATANASGAWTYKTGVLGSGSYKYAATDTTSAGTSAESASITAVIASTTSASTTNNAGTTSVQASAVSSTSSVTTSSVKAAAISATTASASPTASALVSATTLSTSPSSTSAAPITGASFTTSSPSALLAEILASVQQNRAGGLSITTLDTLLNAGGTGLAVSPANSNAFGNRTSTAHSLSAALGIAL